MSSAFFPETIPERSVSARGSLYHRSPSQTTSCCQRNFVQSSLTRCH